MTNGRATLGLCLLSALVFSAVAAPSASASTTAFTCSASADTKPFKTQHCVPGESGTAFGHTSIANGTTTEIAGTGSATDATTTGGEPTFLHSTISGVAVQLKAVAVSLSGTMTNSESGGEMIASGEGKINYLGVSVTKPAGKGCVVKGSVIETNQLKATTAGVGTGIKFEPATAGALFAAFQVEGCSIAALNGLYEVKGSVIGIPNGATVVFVEAATTAAGTLTFRGQKAGLEGKITVSGRANGGQSFTPLSVT